MALYRQARRTSLDWIVFRDQWEKYCAQLRGRFEQNRGATMHDAVKIVADGEKELTENLHPDPYKCTPSRVHASARLTLLLADIYQPGGSKYMRYHPPPPEIIYNRPTDS